MAQKPVDVSDLQKAVDAFATYGEKQKAADHLGIPLSTLRRWLKAGQAAGLKPQVEDTNSTAYLQSRIKQLELMLANEQKKALTHTAIKQTLIGLAQDVTDTAPPKWTLDRSGVDGTPGVPTLFISDLHWGEVVDPKQINHVNRYNLKIAQQRLEFLVERAIRLLKIISPSLDYPGVVIPLGGDMISGNIHDELTATNEINSMPAVLDLYGRFVALIEEMASTFGNVFLPCVSGNHGRDTKKIWAKDRHHTSFDWLLYCFLAKRFEKDERIRFLVPDGPDAQFQIFNHRYLLTHGDQFRGGDGMIGALGPIIRGDHKKRSRNSQVNAEYDTMLLGHWHQYIHLLRLIVNGSLKGYDEYANRENFGFEPPQQALWLTHPKYRMTYRCPVYVDHIGPAVNTPWVQWKS